MAPVSVPAGTIWIRRILNGSLAGGLALGLCGCVARVYAPPPEYVSVPVDVTPSAVVEEYVYYPGYRMYYSNYRHQYYYQEGRNWVYREHPRGISPDALRRAPSVPMRFHGPPNQHHAAVVKQYPRSWTPSPPPASPSRSPRGNPPHSPSRPL